MRTSIPLSGPMCRSAVQTYAQRLREAGAIAVELRQDQVEPCEDGDLEGDSVLYADWPTDALAQREAWDDDDEEPADPRPTVSIRTAAQYHRNLLLLGRDEAFAADWLSGLPAPREEAPGEAEK